MTKSTSHNPCTTYAQMMRIGFAGIFTLTASMATALPTQDEIIALLETVCLPISEGDEPDMSGLTSQSASGGVSGELRVSWDDKSCRVMAPISDVSMDEQEALIKDVADWAEGPVPQPELRGRWSGERPMMSVAHIEDSLGHLALIVHQGSENEVHFQMVWPLTEEEDS